MLIGLMVFDNMKIPNNIGLVEGRLRDMPKKDNAVSSQTDIKEKFVEPLSFKEDLQNSKLIINNIIKNYEGSKIITDEQNYMHIVFTTGKMRYKDDVELLFDETNNLIHYRSESRIGYSDMGLNRKRYENIKNLYLNTKWNWKKLIP